MSKIKLTFVAAAICGGLLALAPVSGAFAAPIAPIGKAANAIDPRSVVYYDGYYRRHYRHYGYYHRPYYRHYGFPGTIMAIIVTVGGATVVGSAIGDTVNNSRSHMATVTGSP